MKSTKIVLLVCFVTWCVYSMFEFVKYRCEINRYSNDAALLMEEMKQPVFNDENTTKAINIASSLVSRNPKEAIADVLTLGWNVWSHYSNGENLKNRLELINSDLTKATHKEHVWGTWTLVFLIFACLARFIPIRDGNFLFLL